VPPRKRELQDRYFRQAKREGYAARSAYKLLEIQSKHSVIRSGDRVLDLGCAPGSWLQVAAQEIIKPPRPRREPPGKRKPGKNAAKPQPEPTDAPPPPRTRIGLVVGVDLKPVTIDLPDNVRTIVGDIHEITIEQLLGDPEQHPAQRSDQSEDDTPIDTRPPGFDVLLSDMAPNTSGGGGGSVDHFRSVRLCESVLDIAERVLAPGGRVAMKVFDGEAFPELLRRCRRDYKKVACLKPSATRDLSRELYVIALGRKAPWKPKATPDQQPA
jgi:23S rRNA (uridine2552-2'-O)-methyltransferase